jgi:hypothetical protein
MYFWNFNAGEKGAFLDEAGKIIALDIEKLIAYEHPDYEIMEALVTDEYCLCNCGSWKYRNVYKLSHKKSESLMILELNIDEETSATEFILYSPKQYELLSKE